MEDPLKAKHREKLARHQRTLKNRTKHHAKLLDAYSDTVGSVINERRRYITAECKKLGMTRNQYKKHLKRLKLKAKARQNDLQLDRTLGHESIR